MSLLLKKALPFALTFAVGAALGGLTRLSGGPGDGAETVLVTRTYDFGPRCGNARRHPLVAETKPLLILFKPDARWPLGAESGKGGASPARVRVTFGADGTIRDARPLTFDFRGRDASLVEVKEKWEAVERAARQIRFTPELVNSVPVTVTRDVEIGFLSGG
ncbi:MAG TPA: hypothetical protein VF654_16700 [Pyrinomonadaceae bacterium]